MYQESSEVPGDGEGEQSVGWASTRRCGTWVALSPAQSKEGDRENLGLNIPEAVSVHRWTERQEAGQREGKIKEQSRSFNCKSNTLNLLSPIIWALCH